MILVVVKKLQKLWEKAEKTGMSSEEMLTLQQEFQHHQEKVILDGEIRIDQFLG